MAATTPTALSADLEHGLRRLKLASMRQVAPELLVTAKTQRWSPEELLRALVEVEITARDASNTRLRSKQACCPTVKTIEGFDLAASSIPDPTWAYLCSLEWISARADQGEVLETLLRHDLISATRSHLYFIIDANALRVTHRHWREPEN